jgi:nucleoside-diphosphate-sugar epimerase
MPVSPLADDGFIVTYFRFATACGVSARLRLDLVLNDFVVSALVNGTIDILSDGTPFRPLITVESMCEALEWGVQRPGSVGGEFLAVNASFDSWNFSVKELAYLVRDMVPGTQVSINATAQPDERSYSVDFAKYRELSGKNKSYDDMGVAIAKLIKMVTDSSYNDKNFRNSTYTRLNFLNELLKHGKIDKNPKIISNRTNIIN